MTLVSSFVLRHSDTSPPKVRLQELLKSPTQSDVKIAVRQLPEDSAPEDEIKRLLRDVKKTGEVNIVLDCATERIQSVLKAAQQGRKEGIM